MVVAFGDPAFNPDWLELLKHDPVHPTISIAKRVSGNRNVYVYVQEEVPQFMVCVRIGNKLPHNMAEVLEDDAYVSKFDVRFAIFYSIFRLPTATHKGAGMRAIKEVIAYCWHKGIDNFYTLSPAPQLRQHFAVKPDEASLRRYLESWQGPVAKFHLSNGARIHSINYDADYSEQRISESWGIMVNYDYNGAAAGA